MKVSYSQITELGYRSSRFDKMINSHAEEAEFAEIHIWSNAVKSDWVVSYSEIKKKKK